MRVLLFTLMFSGILNLICPNVTAASFVISLGNGADPIRQFRAAKTTFELPNCDYPVHRIRLVSHNFTGDFSKIAHALDSIEIMDKASARASFASITTDAGKRIDVSEITDEPPHFVGHPGIATAGRLELDSITIVDLWVSPFSYDATTDRLWFYTDFVLDAGGAEVDLDMSGDKASEVIRCLFSSRMSIDMSNSAESQMEFSPSPSTISSEYIIITSSELAESFEPLVKWKRQLGYSAEVIMIEDIYSQSSGIDNQEKIRNYLVQAYANGTRWVLLGGDENVVPIRYAFHLNRSTDVSVDLQQICDLYYADLTGHWDVDGDGIYGEPTDDAPDITPELMVGRLPVSTANGVTAFVEKSISYEKNPGDGDNQFALHSITAASDQMRDYDGIGQDKLVADELPSNLDIDTWSLAEAPSGYDEAPESPYAADFVSALSDGYNIAYVFAHGMANGFVSKSSGYDHWPKSFVLTGESAPPSHATLCDASNAGRTGMIYSVGCNNGAFDMDVPPYENVDPCVAERLLSLPEAGASAFVGYSRWGWVASSYKFAIDFNDCIYDFDNRLAPANDYSKENNYTIRDLVYGLNVYGDPSMRIWKDMPHQMQTSFPTLLDFGENNFSLDVTDGELSLDSALVTIVGKNGILIEGMTGPDGSLQVAFTLSVDTTITATVSKNGYLPLEQTISPSILLDADDDDGENMRPSGFYLAQNYPNPFNPTTKIAFQIPTASDVRVDVYNLLGQLEETLLDSHLPAGNYSVNINAAGWSSGIYIYRLNAGSFTDSKKMIVLK